MEHRGTAEGTVFDKNIDRDTQRERRGMAATEAQQIYGEDLQKRSREVMQNAFVRLDAGELTPELALQGFCQLREIQALLVLFDQQAKAGDKAGERARGRVRKMGGLVPEV